MKLWRPPAASGRLGRGSLERRVARRFVPFAALGLIVLAFVWMPGAERDTTPAAAGTVLTLLTALCGFLVPWSRLPRWTYILPPLGYFVVVALFREAGGGALSGYEPLVALPTVWVALNLGLRELGIAVAATVAVFAVPLVAVGPPDYPVADWYRAALWPAVSTIVGFAIFRLVREIRERAAESEAVARSLASREHELEAILRLSRISTADENARALICQTALELTHGNFACLAEPAGPSHLAITASSGPRLPRLTLSLDGAPSGAVTAYTTGARVFSEDASSDPHVASRLAERTGSRTVLFEPVRRGDYTIGVLVMGWPEPLRHVGGSELRAVQMLAAEAAHIIERADQVSRLRVHAETDDLTGVLNRRSWDAIAEHALAAARESGGPLSIALVDIDRFKRFNDERGHQAGDQLLREAVAAWRRELRHHDILGRYGGDEFIALLPNCHAHQAVRVLDRLRLATPQGQTCSIGVADTSFATGLTGLVELADRALYHTKARGRDAVNVAERPIAA